jgi:hypothetical protein
VTRPEAVDLPQLRLEGRLELATPLGRFTFVGDRRRARLNTRDARAALSALKIVRHLAPGLRRLSPQRVAPVSIAWRGLPLATYEVGGRTGWIGRLSGIPGLRTLPR